MYVCICNSVTEDDVRGCLSAGLCSPKDVKEACGMKPGCGSCTRRLYALMSEYRTAGELTDAITGGPVSPVMPVEAGAPICQGAQGTDEAVPIAGQTLPVRTIAGAALSGPAAERGSASPTAA
jgi:bacterioferritin-associated ferredoxin